MASRRQRLTFKDMMSEAEGPMPQTKGLVPGEAAVQSGARDTRGLSVPQEPGGWNEDRSSSSSQKKPR